MSVTPIYHIQYPDPTTKLKDLGPALAAMGNSIESALQNASVPPVTNPQIVAAGSAGARDTYWGVPGTEAQRLSLQNKGAQTVRTDLGYTEQYFATYNQSTNPQGQPTPGWYPVSVGGWQSYTPTLTNLNVGNGSVAARWRRIGAKIEVSLEIKLGTSGWSVGTDPKFTLPVPAAPKLAPFGQYNGIGNSYNGGGIGPIVATASATSTTVVQLFAMSGGGYLNIGPSSPGAWQNGACFSIEFSYQPA